MLNASSVNGQYGGFAEFYGIDAVTSETGMVAAGGLFLGKMTFPMSDGSDKELLNVKNAGYGRRQLAPHLLWGGANGFVAKVNMDSGKAVWATDEGLKPGDGNRYYVRTVATTAAGDVLATSDERIDNVYFGKLLKFEGTSGAKVWDVTYDSVSYMYGVEGDADTEVAYVTGILKGTDVDPFGSGTALTSAKGDAVVAALDVSGADGPVAQWVVQIGRGEGASVKSHGDHLYLHGKLSVPTTVGSCSLSGAKGGYLIKLNKTDGACVWAKDTPFGRGTAVTDGTSVWTFNSFSSKVEYDSEHTIYPTAESTDVFAAKYSAADGTGQWAAAIGGTKSDDVGGRGGTGATMTSSGPVFVGTAQSETITLGGLTINHLQHKRAELGLVGDASFGPNQRGETAIFSMLISTIDEQPPCISSCPTGEVSAADTTITSGQCYAYTECLSDGASSMPFPCFKCDAGADQKALSGLGETPPVPDENHCFMNNECVPNGGMRPNYQSNNQPSVCELCVRAVDANDWSLKSGFVHDRTYAQDVEAAKPGRWGRRLQASEAGPEANDFGMLFEKESNGCQIMPEMTMPASPSADLTAALGGATSGAVADVAALASGAIAAVRSATRTNQHAETAWAHYIGNSAACTKSGDVCQHTPSALADMMGADFDTHLHYGDSVARVKVQQGLSMLIAALADSSSEASHIADLKTDVVAHMLIPYYQGAIKSAHHMDAGADAAAKATAQAEGKEYWKVINDSVGDGDFISATDRAYLTSMFASAAGGNFNYCAVSTRLHNSLPPASQLQYVNYVREGTMGTAAGESVVHMTLKDVGLLQGAIDPKECNMPPPPSPSAPPPPIASPAPPSGPAVSSTSNSLSEGEVAGIAVGAVIGGILLLLILGLVLRAFLFKEAKPIFTCLETKDVKTDRPAVAAPVATPAVANNA